MRNLIDKNLLALALAVAGSAAAAAIEVVIPEQAEPTTRLAAEEFTNYVARATGETVELTAPGRGSRAGRKGARVCIGTVDNFPTAIPAGVKEKLAAMKRQEAAYTGADGRTLYFVGRENAAELYAVYHYLEHDLGVRWFQAPVEGDPGDYVPTGAKLSLEPFARYREPRFPERRLDLTGGHLGPGPSKAMATAVRNGFQTPRPYGAQVDFGKADDFFARRMPKRLQSIGGGHLTFVSPMPGSKCFKDHPEYFALVNGERVCAKNDHMSQYCVSNPEVRKNVADYIIGRLERNGGRGRFLFGQVDTPHGMCECANCRAMDGAREAADISSRPSRTTRFLRAADDIAKRVWEVYPEAELNVWAYSRYRELPEGFTPDPRFRCWFCTHMRCYGHDLDDPKCERNRKIYRLILGWRKMLPKLYTYEYLTCTPQLYTCNERQQAHDLRLFRDLDLLGWKEEAPFSDSLCRGSEAAKRSRKERLPSNWQWLCLTGHMLWDPDLDENAFLADYEAKYYGPAYPAMKRYQEFRRRLWNENPAHLGYSTGDQRRPTLLNRAGAKAKLLKLLDEAEKLCAGDAVRLFRVRRDRHWLEEYWIKPNEELKALAGRVFRVPRTATPIAIDGEDGDAAWSAAYYTDKFSIYFSKKDPKPLPPELAVSVGITYDERNLYFLCNAADPQPAKLKMSERPGADVWADDGFEFLLLPPTEENCVYHFAVNAKGNVWAERKPGGRVKDGFGIEAKGRVTEKGFTIEARVPFAGIAAAKPGDTWRVMFGRNRRADADPRMAWRMFSLGGAEYTDPLSYLPMEFAGAYLKNGSFEDLNDKGAPKGWELTGGAKVVETKGGRAVRLGKNHGCHQTMWHGALKQAPKPRKMKYSFRASGRGRIQTSFIRYTDRASNRPGRSYERKCLQPPAPGASFEVDGEAKVFTGEHEIAADEWHSIRLFCADGEVTVDDVTVDPLK